MADTSMSNGVSGMSNGVSGMSNGVSGMSNGVSGMSNGVSGMSNGVSGMSNGVSARSNGVSARSNGVSATSNGVSGMSNGVSHASLKAPTVVPTLIQIKAVIPNYLFESTFSLSMYFLIKDLVLMFLLYAIILVLEWTLPPQYLYIAYPIFWLLQGTVYMALFTIGHDCGHGAFAKSGTVNDVFGTLLHGFVLTPYFPWKISHKLHHRNVGNIDKDEVFYPVRKSDDNGNGFLYLFGLGFSWFVYLWRGYHPRSVNHFNPLETMFGKHVTGCTLSIATVVAWMGCLYYYTCSMGFVALVKYYLIPEVIFASWLIGVTFLHHIGEETPWYSDDNWTYVKGALSSIDRHYGWAHEFIHNIGTHQIHHLFAKIPHYNLEEATAYFQKNFPELKRTKSERIIPAYFRMYRKFAEQFRISDETTVHFYK